MQKSITPKHVRSSSSNYLYIISSFKQQKPSHQNYTVQQQIPFQFETLMTLQNMNKFKHTLIQQIQECSQISFEDLQEQVQFQDFSDFNKIQDNEGIILIQTYFNDVGELVNNNLENSTMFNQRLQEIQENILKNYPFIQVLVKKLSESEVLEKNGAKFGLFEIFLCSQFNFVMKKAVIYSKDLLIQLPTSQTVLINIQKCFKLTNLRVNVSVNSLDHLDPQIVKTQHFRQNKPSLENVQITLTQVKKEQQDELPSKLNSPSSRKDILNYVRQSDAFIFNNFNKEVKNTGNLTGRNQIVRNSLSLKQGIQLISSQITNQSQNFSNNLNSTSLTPRNVKRNTKSNSISKLESEILAKLTYSSCSKNTNQKQNVIKYNSTINSQGQAEFQNILSEVQFYELKIHSSNFTKECTIQLDINELKRQQVNDQNLDLDILIDRNDICSCDVVVTCNSKGIMQCANVYISDQPFSQTFIQNLNQGKKIEAIQLNYNVQTRRYSFYAHPGQYFILVFNQSYYIEERQIYINQGDSPKLDIDLKPLTMTMIRLKAFDIINQCTVPNAEILVKDTQDNLQYCGKTNGLGLMECKLKFSRSFKVSISKNNEYIYFQQVIQLEMNRLVDNNYTVYLIPNSMIQNKQFEILAYFPHKQFDIDFNVRTSDGININKFSPIQKVIIPSCNNYYDQIEFSNSKIIEFSIQNVNSNIDYDIEIYSRTPFSDKKWEEYQKQNLLNANLNEQEILQNTKKPFHRSALNMNNFFIQKRISIDLNLIKSCQEIPVEKKEEQVLLPQTRTNSSIQNTYEVSSINGETVDTIQQYEKSDNSQNDYFKDFHQQVKPVRRKSQLSLFDKQDEINSYYISRNISKFDTEIGSPKGSGVFGQSQKQNEPSNNQSRSMINNSILNGALLSNHSRNVSMHKRNLSNLSLDFFKPFSVKICKQEILEQRNKLKEKIGSELDVKLKKSQDMYVNLKEQMLNQIKQKKKNNIFQIDKDQEPVNFTVQLNKQQHLSEKQLKQESVNSKLHLEGSLLHNNSYFTKKYRRQDTQEFMKRGLERINDSSDLKIIKKMEDQNTHLVSIRNESLKCVSQRDEKKLDWDSSTNQYENRQEKKAQFEKQKKIITEWYIQSKYRGKIKEQITLEKKYPYMQNSQYLYNNLYNVQDLYPFDPYQDEEVRLQNQKKDEQLVKLINYKERLVHAPIIKELQQKLKENNQRVPLIISDAFIKAEKKQNIHHI